MSGYLDNSGRDDVLSGGSRMIAVDTPKGTYRVWVKRTGNHPRLRVLLLHGGPGATHEYLEACDSYLPGAGIEYYYYDQLGSGHSDQPEEPSLWDLDRFVDEVEQVRRALGLDRSSFVLYGQSWGGLLAIEYALHHQEHLRAMVISNMMSSVPAYNAYAEQVLMPAMDPGALAEIKSLEASGDIENPRYMELLNEQHYVHHVLRMPVAEWPDPAVRAFAHINPAIYVSMQGPSELGISAEASLAHWDRTEELASINVPALVIGAQHDTMDPALYGDDGGTAAAGPLPALPGRQPHGHVRRPSGVFRRPDRLPARPRRLEPGGRSYTRRQFWPEGLMPRGLVPLCPGRFHLTCPLSGDAPARGAFVMFPACPRNGRKEIAHEADLHEQAPSRIGPAAAGAAAG